MKIAISPSLIFACKQLNWSYKQVETYIYTPFRTKSNRRKKGITLGAFSPLSSLNKEKANMDWRNPTLCYDDDLPRFMSTRTTLLHSAMPNWLIAAACHKHTRLKQRKRKWGDELGLSSPWSHFAVVLPIFNSTKAASKYSKNAIFTAMRRFKSCPSCHSCHVPESSTWVFSGAEYHSCQSRCL